MTVTTPPGRVLHDGQGTRLEFVRTYDSPVDHLWSALTEPDLLARWIGTVSGDPASGSVDFVMSEDQDETPVSVTIRDCAPPTALDLLVPAPDGTWRLSIRLQAQGGSTTLVFTQPLAEPHDASSIGPGWHYYLDRLGAVIAGRSVPDNWDDYYPVLSDAYAGTG
jgi:uncharacterized protein YndB with AHSA1/START domain